MKLCIFSNVLAKYPKSTELDYIVKVMQSSTKLRTLCEEYRKYDILGNKKEKQRIKRKEVPAFIPSALVFDGKGHRHIIGLTDLCFMDIDGLNEEQINSAMNILKDDEHVVMAKRSMSNKGLHFLVRYRLKDREQPQITTMSYIRMSLTYSAVFNTLSEIYINKLNLPIDESCRNVVQTCTLSYDEELYYNPNATPYTLIYEHQKVGKKHKVLEMVD